MTAIAFFNNKGGVGKTSLVYHLAWMIAHLGGRVVVADLDPQANLTGMFLSEDRLEALWGDEGPRRSIFGAVTPLQEGTGDIRPPDLQEIDSGLSLLPGDLALSAFEAELSESWPKCLDGLERAFRVLTAFHRLLALAREQEDANVVLIDVAPNLGALNRAALIAADHVVVPLGPDLFSLQGLRNLGPTLQTWREGWHKRLREAPDGLDIPLPEGAMAPAGYVIMRHSIRRDRPVKAFSRWMERIPETYARMVATEDGGGGHSVDDDPACLGQLKDYRSLMPMAMESNRPMFFLKPADGAIGGHQEAVQTCFAEFRTLAESLADRCGVPLIRVGQ